MGKSTRAERNKNNRFVVVFDDKMFNVNKTMNKNMHILYGSSGTILTVGDGDFSFSVALAMQLPMRLSDGSTRMLATSYDTLGQVCDKYASASTSINALQSMGCAVLHGIDACNLIHTLETMNERSRLKPGYNPIPPIRKACTRVIFNFPHLGGNTQEDIQANKDLLSNFFCSVHDVLLPPKTASKTPTLAVGNVLNTVLQQTAQEDAELGGQVHVALRKSSFYQSWDIVGLAKAQGLRLLRTVPFHAADYPGYQEQRTNPAVFRALPPPSEGALIYIFVRDSAVAVKSKEEKDREAQKEKEKLKQEEEKAEDKKTMKVKSVVNVNKNAGNVVIVQTAAPANVPMFQGKPITSYPAKSRNWRVGVQEEKKRLKEMGIDIKAYTDEEIAAGIVAEVVPVEEKEEEEDDNQDNEDNEDEDEEVEEDEEEEEQYEEEEEEEEEIVAKPAAKSAAAPANANYDSDDDFDDNDYAQLAVPAAKPVVTPVVKSVVKPAVKPAPVKEKKKDVVVLPSADAKKPAAKEKAKSVKPVEPAIVKVVAPKGKPTQATTTANQPQKKRGRDEEEEETNKKKKGKTVEVLRNYTDPLFHAPIRPTNSKVRTINVMHALKSGDERDAAYRVMKEKEKVTIARKEAQKAAVVNVNLDLFDVQGFVPHTDRIHKDAIKKGGRKAKKNRG